VYRVGPFAKVITNSRDVSLLGIMTLSYFLMILAVASICANKCYSSPPLLSRSSEIIQQQLQGEDNDDNDETTTTV
jgi:hypothetical protein